jgi:ribosomal protein S2
MITLTYKNNNRYLLKIGEYKYHLSEKEVIKLNKQSEKLLKEGGIKNVRNNKPY